MTETHREYMERRRNAMRTERSSFIPHWRELSQFLLPRAGRYFIDDVSKGDKRYQSIINSRATQALRTLRSGLLAGVMSPTRPWFNLVTPDPDMMHNTAVQEWLYQVEKLMQAIFAASNLYNMAPVLLGELALFGTAAMSQVDDFDHVARFYTHTAGSYMLAQNEKFEIDTLCREMKMSVRQLVSKYGLDVCSKTVKNLWDQSNYDAMVPVVHFVEPNSDHDPRKPASKFKAFRSVYYEMSDNQAGPLSDKGFDEFPAHCPRWDVTGEDTYATDCPGMTTLGDVKGLQALERRKAQAIDKMVNPPLKGPPGLRGVNVANMPGGLTIYDGSGGNEKLEPIYSVNPQIQQLVIDIEHHEARIKEGFYEDLFRSIDSMEGVQPQNQLFLSQKNAEKLLQLGPVLERIHGEFLNKLIDRTFAQCVRAKILPPAPPALQGQPLRVSYISTLAMAQREVATVGIDKLTQFIGGLMQAGFTTAADNFDADQAIRIYGVAVGAPPRVLMDPDQVAQTRAHREKEQQQQQQMAMMQQAAQAAQQGAQGVQALGSTPLQGGGNALQALAGAMAPKP